MARLPEIATDLAALRLTELLDLQKRVSVALVERRQTQRADLKAQFAALAFEAGLSLDDVLGLREGAGASKALVPAKYRNPEKPEETLSTAL